MINKCTNEKTSYLGGSESLRFFRPMNYNLGTEVENCTHSTSPRNHMSQTRKAQLIDYRGGGAGGSESVERL
jgi:hypothetical protein